MMIMKFRTGSKGMSVALCAVFFAFVVAACDSGKPGSPTQHGPAKISVVGGDSVGWGRVPPGMLTHEVKIVNAGSDTLKINDVHPSCGCTTAPIDKKNLGPGDTATVKVTMDVSNRTGEQHKSLTITSNDSSRKVLIIPLTADVVREMELVPEFFPVLDSAKLGTEQNTALLIKNTGSEAVTVQPPMFKNAPEMVVRFDMTQARQIAPGDSLRVTATVRPIKEGTASAEAVFNTSSKNSPALKAMITANVRLN